MTRLNKYIKSIDLFEKEDAITNSSKEIIEIEKGACIQKGYATLNKKTGLVDIEGDFFISARFSSKDLSKLNLGDIKGNFTIFPNINITSLKGGPKSVNDFMIVNTNIESLEHFPERVFGEVNCTNNKKLTSVKGLPKQLEKDLILSDNTALKSLEGSPEIIKGDFYVDNCNLTSLEGGPKEVGSKYNCSSNANLTSLKGLPKEVGYFWCMSSNILNLNDNTLEKANDFNISYNNKLTSLEGGPKSVRRYFCRGNKKLTTLKGITSSFEGLCIDKKKDNRIVDLWIRSGEDLKNLLELGKEDDIVLTLITPELVQKEIDKNESETILHVKSIWSKLMEMDPEGFSKVKFSNQNYKDIMDILSDQSDWGF